jgi:hypothetical protein
MRAVLVPLPIVALGVFVLLITPRKRPEVRGFSYARGALWILLGIAIGLMIAAPAAGFPLIVVTFVLWGVMIVRVRRAGL